MIEKKEYLFENEFIKIISPDIDLQQTIAENIKKLKELKRDELQGVFYVMKKLIIAKDDRYDFNQYTFEQFKEMMDEAHLYEGLQEISAAITLALQDIMMVDLQMTALAMKDLKIKLLVELIKSEADGIKELQSAIAESRKGKEEVDDIVALLNERVEQGRIPQSVADEAKKIRINKSRGSRSTNGQKLQ